MEKCIAKAMELMSTKGAEHAVKYLDRYGGDSEHVLEIKNKMKEATMPKDKPALEEPSTPKKKPVASKAASKDKRKQKEGEVEAPVGAKKKEGEVEAPVGAKKATKNEGCG